jgi:hypothetical protein
MRIATAASIAVLALSTAAIAQVASTPTEQKVPAPGQTAPGNDTSLPDNGVATSTDDASTDAVANTVAPPANDMAPATPSTKSSRRPR